MNHICWHFIQCYAGEKKQKKNLVHWKTDIILKGHSYFLSKTLKTRENILKSLLHKINYVLLPASVLRQTLKICWRVFWRETSLWSQNMFLLVLLFWFCKKITSPCVSVVTSGSGSFTASFRKMSLWAELLWVSVCWKPRGLLFFCSLAGPSDPAVPANPEEKTLTAANQVHPLLESPALDKKSRQSHR